MKVYSRACLAGVLALFFLLLSGPSTPAAQAQGLDPGDGKLPPVGSPTPSELAIPKDDPLIEPPAALPDETSPAAAPANDDFNAALAVTSLPYESIQSTTQATIAADDPAMGCGASRNSNTVWYKLTPQFDGAALVGTIGSGYDTVLAVFTGTRSNLNLIACSDDAVGTVQSLAAFYVTAGATYYIEIADYGNAGGGQLVFRASTYFAASPLANGLLRANVASSPTNDLGFEGRFTLGTTGGDPNTTQDDNKRLLYGYPLYIGSSYTTLRLDNGRGFTDYRLGQDVAPVSTSRPDASTILTVWQVGPVRVEQRLRLTSQSVPGQMDAVAIEYTLVNTGAAPVQAGARIMLDTMIGNNDGAPLFAPRAGRIETEREFYALDMPDYWLAWESPSFDAAQMKARGSLRGAQITTPDRLVIAHWGAALCRGAGSGLYASPWNYTINPSQSVVCDSAVALYYDPEVLNGGQSRVVRALYGIVATSTGIALASDVASFVAGAQAEIAGIGSDALDVAIVGDFFLDKLTTDLVSGLVEMGSEAFSLVQAGASWSRVGSGLQRMAEPGYQASIHANWSGWTKGSPAARHWYKPLYDSLHNGRDINQKLFAQLAKAGLRYYAEDLAPDGIAWLINILDPQFGDPFLNELGEPAVVLGESYRAELEREQNELLTRLVVLPLTAEQIVAYRNDMTAREAANDLLASRLAEHRDLLWQSYQDRLASDANWLNFWGPLIGKWAVIGVCTLAWDGPGYYVSTVATGGVSLLLTAAETARALTEDQNMTSQAKDFLLGRHSSILSEIALNTVGALNLVRAGDLPQIADATVTVSASQSHGHYRLWPNLWWAEEASLMRLNIANETEYATTVRTAAVYNHSTLLGGSERFLPEGESVDIPPAGSGQVTIQLKWPNGIGESPDEGSLMGIQALGNTDTGLYPLALLTPVWNPSRVETGSLQAAAAPPGYSPEQAQAAPVLPYPLAATIASRPGTTTYVAFVQVINPLAVAVQAMVTQTLPAALAVLDPDGAAISGNSLVWQTVLQPGEARTWRAQLNWVGGLGQVVTAPPPTLSFQSLDNSGGDQYAGQVTEVAAPWPIKTTAGVARAWQIGEVVTMSMTFINILSAQTLDAVLSTEVAATDGTVLWSDQRPLTIAPGASQSTALTLDVPRWLGFVTVTSQLRVGDETRTVMLENVELQGIPLYLPMITR